jgi:hypothetical protein
MLHRIHKSHMSRISIKHNNPIVAHLATSGTGEPLCQSKLPKGAHWITEHEPAFNPERDCQNCLSLAKRSGLR